MTQRAVLFLKAILSIERKPPSGSLILTGAGKSDLTNHYRLCGSCYTTLEGYVVKLLIRIVAFPFILTYLVALALGHALVWVFDPTYDHKAGNKAYTDNTSFLNSLH